MAPFLCFLFEVTDVLREAKVDEQVFVRVSIVEEITWLYVAGK